MITETAVVETSCTDPYRNLAAESLLLETVRPGRCVMYLWQNRHTVVIGRNQNAWKECRVAELEAGGGNLARRLSGGGAVYHDLGNLNFTFLLPREDYDTGQQCEVILRAVRIAGIEAEKTGRNDIETHGRKFSGNAFYLGAGAAYHHGTILFDADIEAAARFLTVNADKFRAKGIASVRSRMINLRELKSSLDLAMLKDCLKKAFTDVYGLKSEVIDEAALDKTRIAELEQRFASPEWKYGRNPPFSFKSSSRFSWGSVEIRLDIEQNLIKDACVFSDAMDERFVLECAQALKGIPFEPEAVSRKLHSRFGTRGECVDIAEMLFDH